LHSGCNQENAWKGRLENSLPESNYGLGNRLVQLYS
jgi:hypothetical protein